MGGEALVGLTKEITQMVPEHRVRPFHGGIPDYTLGWFELR
jgi:hypothetical protein